MKWILFMLLSLPASAQQSYIDSCNEATFLQLGSETKFVYKCEDDDCRIASINISDSYMRDFKLITDLARRNYANQILDQYDYLFKSRGFTQLIVRVEGVEPVSKSLKQKL